MPLQTELVDWLICVEAEYREMPGLQLMERRMQRLWFFDVRICDAFVDTLVASGFLFQRADRAYARVDRRV